MTETETSADDPPGGLLAPGFTASPTRLLRAGEGFDLAAVDPSSTPGFSGDKAAGKRALQEQDDALDQLQERLYASSRVHGDAPSVLLILQAMDTAGKGGILRHVVGSMDPQGIHLHAFKAPTPDEQRHGFLWRVMRELPDPGIIGVFDRSHYEDVLIHRVEALSPLDVIESRYGQIRDFERRVADAGTRILKVMLHISPQEQYARLSERLDRPDKHWKFNPGDVDARRRWSAYMDAYRIAIARTDADQAPWFVVPANRKWYARVAVQALLIEALWDLDPRWPSAAFDVAEQRARLDGTRALAWP